MWAQIAKAASAIKHAGNGAAAVMDTKLLLAKYFMERIMPETGAHLARISTGAATIMALEAERF
jgi:hypothetical protein